MISHFGNGYISDESFFLNAITKWDAIILGNYEGGIALPFIKKFGIKKLWQPPFIQRLTLFGIDDEKMANEVFKLICKNYQWFHFNLDFKPDILHHRCIIKERKNYVLPLNCSFYLLSQNFSKSVRKKLKQGSSLLVQHHDKDINYNKFFELYRNAYGALNPQITSKHFESLSRICKVAEQNDQLFAVEVKNAEETVAGLLFFIYKNRITYFLGAPTAQGRNCNALSFALFDVMRKYQNADLMLDFEGSSIPSVATFYASFGAELEYFYEVKYRFI